MTNKLWQQSTHCSTTQQKNTGDVLYQLVHRETMQEQNKCAHRAPTLLLCWSMAVIWERMTLASGRAAASLVNSSSRVQRWPISERSKNSVLLFLHRNPATTCVHMTLPLQSL